jgi:SAM-dependent methyltransferase
MMHLAIRMCKPPYTPAVTFDVKADAYDLFMGRYSVQLSPQLADLAAVVAGQRALDVGSGPGALTAELVARLGADAVTAVDPSVSFVDAARRRHPGVTVMQASAEDLRFADGEYEVALAQLVVHFMSDPVRGIGEMRRVTRPGGVVAACVWDLAGGRAPLSPFWRAAHDLDLDVTDESRMPGAREGHLGELFEAAGLRDLVPATLSVSLEHPTFEDWWEPYTRGVGPAGGYVAKLNEEQRVALRERCRAILPDPPFVLEAMAWAVRGTV